MLAAVVVGLLAIVAAALPTLSAHAQETAPETAPGTMMPNGPTQAAPALMPGQPDGAGADGEPDRSASAPTASASAPAGDPAPGTAPGPVAQAHLPQDLSPINMFRAADIVVKAVMIGLAFASVLTWTVLVVKALELWRASAAARAGLNCIARADSLSSAAAAVGRRDAVSCMIRAAAEEYDRSLPALAVAGDDGLRERVESRLERIEAVAARRMARGTGILASIGSTAPFVGLFGTVWGIMNSFIGISEARTTNLAVVAPGIAEALLATAIGLVAAIPAVVIYNVFARAIAGYRLRLADAAAALRQLVSRDLDFRGVEPAAGGH